MITEPKMGYPDQILAATNQNNLKYNNKTKN